jgi:hypothetical protein
MNIEWGSPLPLEEGQAQRHWSWGAFHLSLHASPSTATVHGRHDGEPRASEPVRYLRSDPPRKLVLTARTADRSVIARPAVPLVVLGSGHATIYVSSPLWVGVAELGDPPFAEFPTRPPKQTWFGATPQAGMHAYATRTRARADLANLQLEAGRVVTQVELVNPLPDPWPIERIEVPLPHLALFLGDGHLWTSSVRVVRSGEAEVDAHITAAPPDAAGLARRLGNARIPSTPRLSLLALGRWGWS